MPLGSSCRCNSYSRSIVAKRSIGENSAANARSMVVFPAFWAPVTMTFLPARIAAPRNSATARDIDPHSTIWSRDTSRTRCRRITTTGRGVTQAMAVSREPSSRRRCRLGLAVEKGRALTSLREAKNTRKSMSSASLSATGGPGDEPAVAQLEGDLVVAGDDDVLHHLVVYQRLEPAEAEQGIVDRGLQRVLLG